MIAQVAVSAAVYAIDKPYSYRIPPALTVEPGMRVSLPFGQGNRLCEGVVLAVEDGEEEGLKAVSAVLDSAPVLSQPFLHLAAFLRERYFCTFYDAAKAMLPAGLWFQVREELTLEAAPAEVPLPKTHSRAGEILTALETAGGRMAMAELKKASTQLSQEVKGQKAKQNGGAKKKQPPTKKAEVKDDNAAGESKS